MTVRGPDEHDGEKSGRARRRRSRRMADRADVYLTIRLMRMAGFNLQRMARVLGVTRQAVHMLEHHAKQAITEGEQ